MRILICDDTEMMRLTLNKFLSKLGHEVVAECSNGQQAIESYMETKPDVCLLDIAMPGMDGITVLKKIRERDPEAKAIMCTGRDDNMAMIETLQIGAIDFIAKPFTPQRLMDALAKVEA